MREDSISYKRTTCMAYGMGGLEYRTEHCGIVADNQHDMIMVWQCLIGDIICTDIISYHLL